MHHKNYSFAQRAVCAPCINAVAQMKKPRAARYEQQGERGRRQGEHRQVGHTRRSEEDRRQAPRADTT